jgi:hypothetical protein
MGTLLAKNATVVVTMDGQRRELRNAGLFARDGMIEQVGPTAALPGTADVVLDLAGHILLPGLINCHHHLDQILTRNLPAGQNTNLFPWLMAHYRIWARRTPEDTRTAVLIGCGELATANVAVDLFKLVSEVGQLGIRTSRRGRLPSARGPTSRLRELANIGRRSDSALWNSIAGPARSLFRREARCSDRRAPKLRVRFLDGAKVGCRSARRRKPEHDQPLPDLWCFDCGNDDLVNSINELARRPRRCIEAIPAVAMQIVSRFLKGWYIWQERGTLPIRRRQDTNAVGLVRL